MTIKPLAGLYLEAVVVAELITLLVIKLFYERGVVVSNNKLNGVDSVVDLLCPLMCPCLLK